MERVKVNSFFYLITITPIIALGIFFYCHKFLILNIEVSLLMALIVFPIVHIAFNFTNQSKKKGVFLSKEYIYFSEGELRILWDDLEVEIVKSFPLLKYTELRFKSFKTSESTIAYIFIDNRDSYKVLIEKYVRKTHMLALIFKNL